MGLMHASTKQDLLQALNAVVLLLDKHDLFGVSELSNHTIRNAAIYQDHDSINFAVITYALSKIFSRTGKLDSSLLRLLKKAREYLEKNNVVDYRKTIKRLFSRIAKIDSKLHLYIKEVIVQSQVKKGYRMHDQGLSLAQVADLMDISQWELMHYMGNTTVSTVSSKRRTNERLRVAKELFGV